MVHSPKALGLSVHFTLIRFILLCCILTVVKISKGKAHILEEKVKFLGFDYDTATNSSEIPEDRQEGFDKLRSPKSLAELNSRLGSFSYLKSYIPNLKKLAAPLLTLAKSDKFYCNRLEAEAFNNIKMVIQAKIKNFHLEREQPLFLASDSSQI